MQSSAQIAELYKAEELVGRQVVCVVIFPPKRIAGFKYEVLIMGIDGDGNANREGSLVGGAGWWRKRRQGVLNFSRHIDVLLQC